MMPSRSYGWGFLLIATLIVLAGGFLHVPFWLAVVIGLGVAIAGWLVSSRKRSSAPGPDADPSNAKE